MKIFCAFFVVFLCSNASAEMYKCDIDGKTSYQDEPCEKRGGTGHKFKKKFEISKEQQQQARAKLDLEETRMVEQERLELKAQEKEYKTRLEEEKLLAIQEQADQAQRQARALEERNSLEVRQQSGAYGHRSHYNGSESYSNDRLYTNSPIINKPYINRPTTVRPTMNQPSKHAKVKNAVSTTPVEMSNPDRMSPPDRMRP